MKHIASNDREFNLAKLISVGRLSPKLKIVLKKLLVMLRKRDGDKIWRLAMVHQYISSGYKLKQYLYNEDAEYNNKMTGTTAYHETDMIAHGSY